MNICEKTIKTKINLKHISNDFALFSLDQSLSGLINVAEHGLVTVILNEGYILGRYTCFHKAIHDIKSLYADIIFGDEAAGMSYADYRRVFNEGASASK